MTSLFDFICRQLQRVAATAATAAKYPVPAVTAHAKDEEVPKAAAMSTDRTFQVAQDWQSSHDEMPLRIACH
jgi:hypothetical protein